MEILGPSVKMQRDYNATELTVRGGEEVFVLEEESGWVFCRTMDGRKGWLPYTIIDFEN